ncbi:hypothetical protein FACS1894142_0510 [Spirochaetia bacterium]|nr:hypothetical protein FACS1894142_0510 [Spirochaetia bacterium]
MPDDILTKVFSLFSGDNGPDSDKKGLLRQAIKDLSQNKYAKMYRPKSEELDPAFAAYWYTVYRMIYPAQAFLKDAAQGDRIKQITIEAFMNKPVHEVVRRLSPEVVAERTKTTDPAEMSRQLKDDLAAITTGFDSQRRSAVNRCYNLITALSQFAAFNFVAMLRKFDPDIQEGVFSIQPKFGAVKGESLARDLSDLLAVLLPLEPGTDWKTALEVLKICKGSELIPLGQWNTLLLNLKDLKQSGIIELMVRCSLKDPVWVGRPKTPNAQVAESWMEQKAAEIEGFITRIANSQRNARQGVLAAAVFGAADITRLHYYTVKNSEAYSKKDLDGYAYAAALNYLTVFIEDYLKKEMQELCDILLVRGQWSSNTASLEMSDGFHDAVDLIGAIEELDATLSEKGTNGPRLRAALLRVDRDKTQARYINGILDTINGEALELINKAVPAIIIVGKHMKSLIDDYQKSLHELIINWRELASVSKLPLGPRMVDAYKKINEFVQLMVLLTQEK